MIRKKSYITQNWIEKNCVGRYIANRNAMQSCRSLYKRRPRDPKAVTVLSHGDSLLIDSVMRILFVAGKPYHVFMAIYTYSKARHHSDIIPLDRKRGSSKKIKQLAIIASWLNFLNLKINNYNSTVNWYLLRIKSFKTSSLF